MVHQRWTMVKKKKKKHVCNELISDEFNAIKLQQRGVVYGFIIDGDN